MNQLERSITKCKQFFIQRYSLKLPEDWLIQCVEFALEDEPDGNIEEIVFQQLCDFDMSEIGTSCLPEILIKTENGIIEGVFLLQISFWCDAAESYYNKIQKILGQINENALVDADNVPGATQWEKRFDKKNRLVTLFLTDGSISIKAIEHQHIPVLNDELLPGRKVLLKGRMKYQNRVLFLKPENVELLEGFVEGISNSEHFVELLQAELEAKRNQGSCSERELIKKFEGLKYTSGRTKVKKEKASQPSFPKQKNAHQNNFDDEDEDELLQTCNLNMIVPSNNKSNNVKSNMSVMKRAPSSEVIVSMQKSNKNGSNFGKKLRQETIPDSDEEDELLKGNFIEHVESKIVKTNVLNSNQNIQNNRENCNNLKNSNFGMVNNIKHKSYEDMDTDDLNNIDFENIRSNKLLKKQSNQYTMNVKTEPVVKNEPVMKKESTIKMETKVKSERLGKIEPVLKKEQSQKIESLMQMHKLEFLESCCLLNQPNKNGPINLSSCCHRVKCEIETLTDRLKQFKLKWYQECIIKELSSVGRMEAYIGDLPMSKLLGMTAAQVKEKYLKGQSADYDRAKLECDQKLEKIRCVMNLKFDFEKRKFCVWDIENEEY